MALGQTPAEAAASWTRDHCVASCACLLSSLWRYQLILLSDRANVFKQIFPVSHSTAQRLGLNPELIESSTPYTTSLSTYELPLDSGLFRSNRSGHFPYSRAVVSAISFPAFTAVDERLLLGLRLICVIRDVSVAFAFLNEGCAQHSNAQLIPDGIKKIEYFVHHLKTRNGGMWH